MTARSTVDIYFDAVNESSAALFDAIAASMERNRHLSSSLLTEMQRSQHDLLDFWRAFAADPSERRDLPGRLRTATERGRERQREVQREWLDGQSQSRSETLDTIERLAAQRRAMEDAAAGLARDTVNAVVDRLQDALRRLTEPTQTQATVRGLEREQKPRQARSGRARPKRSPRRKGSLPPEWLTSPTSTEAAATNTQDVAATEPESAEAAVT